MASACLFMMALFQSTHPVRGGTGASGSHAGGGAISIHPPREGWDGIDHLLLGVLSISIHPPREGWDTL